MRCGVVLCWGFDCWVLCGFSFVKVLVMCIISLAVMAVCLLRVWESGVRVLFVYVGGVFGFVCLLLFVNCW